jgi:hypothetical protein
VLPPNTKSPEGSSFPVKLVARVLEVLEEFKFFWGLERRLVLMKWKRVSKVLRESEVLMINLELLL